MYRMYIKMFKFKECAECISTFEALILKIFAYISNKI